MQCLSTKFVAWKTQKRNQLSPIRNGRAFFYHIKKHHRRLTPWCTHSDNNTMNLHPVVIRHKDIIIIHTTNNNNKKIYNHHTQYNHHTRPMTCYSRGHIAVRCILPLLAIKYTFRVGLTIVTVALHCLYSVAYRRYCFLLYMFWVSV
jgi:hypothetical protein